MDSYYELPRTAPIQTSTEKLGAVPAVPEVSMIFQNNPQGNCSTQDSIHLSYNAWKTRNRNENGLKHNYCMDSLPELQVNKSRDYVTSQGLTKQVRFESPTTLRQQLPQCINSLSKTTAQPVLNNTRFPNHLQTSVAQNVNTNLPVKSNKFSKPFEQIYMANIPNRHLDLSIIDPPRAAFVHKENLENISPNVNLASNEFYTTQDIKQADTIGKNYGSNSKNEYPEKLGAHSTQYKKGKSYDVPKINELDNSDPLEKNKIIDLYNYKGEGMETVGRAYEHRQILDNVKLVTDCNSPNPVVNNHKTHSCPNTCLYNSFDSHSCENNKHPCNCRSNKKFHIDTRNSAAIQTEMGSVVPNTCESVDIISKTSDEPTVKDLLKIIHQQNDQLLILQKQVSALLNTRDAPKQIEGPPISDRNLNVFGEKCRTSTQLETQGLCNPLQKCLPRKGSLPQFSLDVMTSFEVSIRRQQNLNRAYTDAMNHQPKICEVTETDSNAFDHSQNSANVHDVANVLSGISNKAKVTDNTDVSLTLNEPVHVPETCHTPENTVRIDMEDYSSDSDDDTSSEERWFYKNVQGQVNNILRKSGIWPNNASPLNFSEHSDNLVTQNVRKKVKDATIKHLKSIGVHVPTLDETDGIVESDIMGYNPKSNEISFAVKQLLMKYLPTEQLAKLAYLQTQNTTPQECSEKTGLIQRRPEFSFATVQYMQKYNLLTDAQSGRKVTHQPQMLPTVRQEENFDRILDTTAIRQQPKLL